MLTINKIWFRYFSIVIVVAGLGGCANFDKEKMVIQDYNSPKTHPHSLTISVDGENNESDVGLVPIPKQDLQYAIESSIRESRVFERIVSTGGDYILNVRVFSLEQPTIGFTMRVKMEVGWTLTKIGQGIVWQKLIKSEYTLGVGDAFSGSKRLHMATDGAIKNNIRKGIKELSRLNVR